MLAIADSPVITIPSLSSSPGAPHSTVKRRTGVPAGVMRISGWSSSRPSSSIRFPVTFGPGDFLGRRFHYFFGSVGRFFGSVRCSREAIRAAARASCAALASAIRRLRASSSSRALATSALSSTSTDR